MKYSTKSFLVKYKTINTINVLVYINAVQIKVLPANIYLFKINSRNTRERCELC